ncbi:MAG: AsmA family protein [Proteobacteria bacterium]|jgi:hypothetical protein|nr:AsmA family protein [Pseudomonadota bacterium]
MTRAVRISFYAIASLFVLLVTLAGWIVFFFDASKLQEPIANLVESRSGYRFSFDGPIQIDFDLDNGLVARVAFSEVSLVKIGGMTTTRALDIDSLSLNLNWTQIKGMLSGEHIQGVGSFVISQIDIPALSQELDVDWTIFNSNAFQQASGRGDFKIINNQIEVSDFQFHIADTQVSGTLKIKDWERTPSSQFNIFIPTLDIGHYLRTDHQSFFDGFILLSLPAFAVSAIDVEGLVSIGSLHSAGIVMEDVRVPVHSRDGQVVSSPVSAKLYGGSILIDTLMSREDDRAFFYSYQQITDIQIGQALADIGLTEMVEARADLNLALAFSAQDLIKEVTSADGVILLTGTNGKLKGFDLQRLIQQLTEGDRVDASLWLGDELTTRVGDFSVSVKVANGRVESEDLAIEIADLEARGAGQYRLQSERLNYRLFLSLEGSDVAKLLPAPLNSGLMVLPLQISGNREKPDVSIDMPAFFQIQMNHLMGGSSPIQKRAVDPESVSKLRAIQAAVNKGISAFVANGVLEAEVKAE